MGNGPIARLLGSTIGESNGGGGGSLTIVLNSGKLYNKTKTKQKKYIYVYFLNGIFLIQNCMTLPWA